MKVYIVTSGSYSDYHIDRVFLSENKAHEYLKRAWAMGGHGCVEYFETSDDKFDIGELKDKTVINAIYYFDEGFEYIDTYIDGFDEPDLNKFVYDEYFKFVSIIKVVSQNYNEEEIKKILYDKYAEIKSLVAEGYTEEQINEMIN